jgi:hypothetical protein
MVHLYHSGSFSLPCSSSVIVTLFQIAPLNCHNAMQASNLSKSIGLGYRVMIIQIK